MKKQQQPGVGSRYPYNNTYNVETQLGIGCGIFLRLRLLQLTSLLSNEQVQKLGQSISSLLIADTGWSQTRKITRNIISTVSWRCNLMLAKVNFLLSNGLYMLISCCTLILLRCAEFIVLYNKQCIFVDESQFGFNPLLYTSTI